jgi:guanylate kinase
MSSKIVLVGKAASGKDFFRKRMMDKGFTFGVSCTTRLKRIKDNEVDGKDYHFKSDAEFDTLIEAGEFVEYQSFNGWRYGITKDEFDNSDVMIMNAEAVKLLPSEYAKRCFIIYLDIPLETRIARITERNDIHDNVMRRVNDDEKQYLNFSQFDCKITNSDF